MASDAKSFADRLEHRRYKGLEFKSPVFEGEDHGSVIPAAIADGARFVHSAE